MKILEARQEAKLNMYEVVETHCTDNAAATATNKAFEAAFDELKPIIANIKSSAQLSSAVLTGIAADKKVSKRSLSELSATMGGRIYAFAAKNGNNTLKDAVNFSVSDLLRLKDGELAPRCQAIHDAGITNLAALSDYGVTNDKLAELQTAITAYSVAVPKPRTAISNRSTLKANIKQMFKDADAILVERMDKLVEDYAKDNSDFVLTYKSARVIVDPKQKKKPNGENDNNGGNTPA